MYIRRVIGRGKLSSRFFFPPGIAWVIVHRKRSKFAFFPSPCPPVGQSMLDIFGEANIGEKCYIRQEHEEMIFKASSHLKDLLWCLDFSDPLCTWSFSVDSEMESVFCSSTLSGKDMVTSSALTFSRTRVPAVMEGFLPFSAVVFTSWTLRCYCLTHTPTLRNLSLANWSFYC